MSKGCGGQTAVASKNIPEFTISMVNSTHAYESRDSAIGGRRSVTIGTNKYELACFDILGAELAYFDGGPTRCASGSDQPKTRQRGHTTDRADQHINLTL